MNGMVGGEFLGTNSVAPKNKIYLTYEEAKKHVQSFHFKTTREYKSYHKNNKIKNIPSNPKEYYKEHTNMNDFLGNGIIASKDVHKFMLKFDEARKFVRSLKLKNSEEWEKYCVSGEKPKNIPSCPRKVYKKEFLGIRDWIG